MDTKTKARILKGQLQGQPGEFVCDSDGRMLGFVPNNYKDHSSDLIVLGPKGTIVLVILCDGTMQNPDGSPSVYTDPVEYLLIKAPKIIQPPDNDGEVSDDRDVKSVFGRVSRKIKISDVQIEFDLAPNDYGLFLVIGQAMSEIQSFELFLAGLLASLDNKKGQTTSYEELLVKHYTSTLGGLVKHFRDHINNPETASALAYARDRRNFLVHGLLRKYSWPGMSNADYRICVLEIMEIVSAVSYAQDKLIRYLNESQTMPIVQFEFSAETLQLTEDEIKEKIAKQLKPWKKNG